MRKLVAVLVAALIGAALTTSAVAGAPPVKHAKVDVDHYSYTPGTLRIKKGTKVIWTWVDGSDTTHDIAVFSGPAHFHSQLKSSGTFTHIFNRRGKYVLYCRIHPYIMRETVIVK